MSSIDFSTIPSFLVTFLSVAVIVVGVGLAKAFPRIFGFLIWEIGVVEKEGESQSDYYGRASKYWFKTSLVALVVLYISVKTVSIEEGSYVAAMFYIVAPMVIAAGFLRSALDYFWSRIYHGRDI